MLLVVRRKDNQQLYPVLKYWVDDVGKAFICCEGWPGEHTTKDCCFIPLREDQERIVAHVFDNPDHSITQIAHSLKMGYMYVFRQIKCLNLSVKADRKKQDKKKASKLYSNTAFSAF